MSEPPVDLERIQRFISGDATAFEEIVGVYQGRIVTLCRYLLGNAADADDAAQDVFVKAFKNVHRFRPEAALYTWLYRIAVNTCIDRRRKPFFLSLFSAGDAAEGAAAAHPDLRSEDPSPAQLVEAQQISREIQRALTRLSPKLRAAIVLKEIEGLRYEQIAEVLEISPGTVKSRISRARAELQEALAGLREQNGRRAV